MDEQVEKHIFEEENERVLARGGQPAKGEPLLLGITKASLSTESFISASSFQEMNAAYRDAFPNVPPARATVRCGLTGKDYLVEITMLAVKTRTEQFTLINQNGEWVLEDRPTEKLNQQAVDLFVSRVANVPAEERVVKQAGPLAPYGLVNPAAEFTATGKDGKLAGRLSIGDQANGLAYAMGLRLQGIFQIRPDLLKQIPTKAELLTPAN